MLLGVCVAGLAGPLEEGPGAKVANYSGEISAEHNRRFFDSVSGRTISRLLVNSGGGEVEAGIALGLWVFEHEVDIEVGGICLSSCANYVFPAARRKVVRPGGVVAWHGNYRHLKETGLWREDVDSRVARYGEDQETARRRVHAQVEHLVGLEHDFFERIGVDGHLCWIGKMPPYNVPNYYFLSQTDMEHFGVTDLHLPQGYEDTDLSTLPYDIVYLRLETQARSR